MNKHIKGDTVIWIITLLLLIISLPAVYSASAMISHKSYQGDMHFLLRQLFAVFIALVVVYISYRIPFKTYLSLIKILFPIALILLVLTIFSGVSHNDARRWLEIPGIGIELQTSEIAKIALIMFIAAKISIGKDEESKDKNAKMAAWAVLLSVALIFPADLSSALMIMFIATLMMFVSGVKLKKVYVVILIAIGVFILYVLLAELMDLPGRFSTWVHRIEIFFAPENELSADETYQSDISKMAIVNGGFWGKGPETVP
jgi:cell division protein FtsW